VHRILNTEALLGPGTSSVLQATVLRIVPQKADPVVLSRPVVDSTVTFDVTVPAGPMRIGAEIRSNNNALLYEGHRDTTLTTDGFAIVLPVTKRDGILAIHPSDFGLGGNIPADSIQIENLGVDSLTWLLGPTMPPDTCTGAPLSTHCRMTFSELGGTLPPGTTHILRVFYSPNGFSSNLDFVVPIRSRVGTVFAHIHLPGF
jgi:hypothetical protein